MKKYMLLVPISVLILFNGCGLIAPVNVVNEFFKNVKNKNIKAAMELISSESDLKEDATGTEAFLNTRKITEYSFKKVTLKNGKAEVRGYIVDNNQKIFLKIILRKYNGDWKIFEWDIIEEKDLQE